MQTASHGADRNVQNFRNLFVGKFFQLTKDNNVTEFLLQIIDNLTHYFDIFLRNQVFVGSSFSIYKSIIHILLDRFGHSVCPIFPSHSDGDVEGDPIQPSVKLAATTERVQPEVGLHERVLSHIVRIFRAANNLYHCIVQPHLIFRYEFPKSVTIPLQCLLNQLVVVHFVSRLTGKLDNPARNWFPFFRQTRLFRKIIDLNL